MKVLALVALVIGLSACGHSEHLNTENGVCYKHARYWFIGLTIENDTNRVEPELCESGRRAK